MIASVWIFSSYILTVQLTYLHSMWHGNGQIDFCLAIQEVTDLL